MSGIEITLDMQRDAHRVHKLRLPTPIKLPLKEKLTDRDWFALGRAFGWNNRYGFSTHLMYIDLLDYKIGANFALWIFEECVIIYPYPPVKSSAKRFFVKLVRTTLRDRLDISDAERSRLLSSALRSH